MKHWLAAHTPLDKARAKLFGLFILRWFFGTWAALIAIIAGHITFLQMVPTHWFINVQHLKVVQRSGEPWIEVRRRTRYETPVIIFAELHSARNPAKQYCTYSYATISEPLPTNLVESPLAKALPFCRFGQLPADDAFVLHLTYRLDLDYGIHKQTGVVSRPFTLDLVALKQAERDN